MMDRMLTNRSNRFAISMFMMHGCVVFSLGTANAASCPLGERTRVLACTHLEVTAQWDEDIEGDCLYNPPPGYAIIDAETDEYSANNGSSSVSVIAGDSTFATEGTYENARSFALSIAAQKGQDKYNGTIDQAITNYSSSARSFNSSHNAVYARVSASGSGEFFDRRRGWEKINVYANLMCVGSPDAKELAQEILKIAGVPEQQDTGTASNVRLIAFKTNCKHGVDLEYFFKNALGEWEGPIAVLAIHSDSGFFPQIIPASGGELRKVGDDDFWVRGIDRDTKRHKK
jgi:hypothetical protein